MLPNVDLGTVGPRLVSLLRRGDLLLMSANLARGTDYVAATQAVLPLYDNAETRAWLGMTLEELGLSPKEGEWRFEINRSPWMTGLLRIAVSFVPARAALIGAAGGAGVELSAGRPIQLFHSNRFTVELVEAFAAACGLEVLGSALIPSGDEGVFLATRAAGAA
jgi:hypothetical protein